jgi:GNAT superfamily N-acetyltransferase
VSSSVGANAATSTEVPVDGGSSTTPGQGTRGLAVVDLAGRPDAAGLLRRIYDDILVPSFRAEELDRYETLAAALAEEPPSTDVAAACDESGEVLGAMIGDWDAAGRVYLLSYLAVRPGGRSRGVGTRLMQHLSEWWRARQPLVTLAEVDDPRRHAASSSVGDPAARLSFYGRFGARVLDLPYFQPRLSGEGQRAHGMLLLAFDVHADALADGPVSALRGDVLGGFLRRYFADAEGIASTDAEGTVPTGDGDHHDPDLARLLVLASSPTGVRLLPVERYADVGPDTAGPGTPDAPG